MRTTILVASIIIASFLAGLIGGVLYAEQRHTIPETIPYMYRIVIGTFNGTYLHFMTVAETEHCTTYYNPVTGIIIDGKKYHIDNWLHKGYSADKVFGYVEPIMKKLNETLKGKVVYAVIKYNSKTSTSTLCEIAPLNATQEIKIDGFLALPKDGKPVVEGFNLNVSYNISSPDATYWVEANCTYPVSDIVEIAFYHIATGQWVTPDYYHINDTDHHKIEIGFTNKYDVENAKAAIVVYYPER